MMRQRVVAVLVWPGADAAKEEGDLEGRRATHSFRLPEEKEKCFVYVVTNWWSLAVVRVRWRSRCWGLCVRSWAWRKMAEEEEEEEKEKGRKRLKGRG